MFALVELNEGEDVVVVDVVAVAFVMSVVVVTVVVVVENEFVLVVVLAGKGAVEMYDMAVEDEDGMNEVDKYGIDIDDVPKHSSSVWQMSNASISAEEKTFPVNSRNTKLI